MKIPFGESTEFNYINYRGEKSRRHVIAHHLWFGTTEWHNRPQWFLRAFDVDKRLPRDFALSDIVISSAPQSGELPSKSDATV